MNSWELFVTCARGLEGLLTEELRALGLSPQRETAGGVWCKATLEQVYKACLWSRVANRVYLPLLTAPAGSAKAVYEVAFSCKWESVLKNGATLAVDFKGSSESIRNTMFGAQIVKDGIVDRLQKKLGTRPNIEPKTPDCLIHARLHNGELTLFYDLSGHSLHQRGYRKQAGEAPLKENLAAAILLRSGWSKDFERVLVDPCCGSGTLLIEAAMMATNKAPGLDRLDYGFLGWQGHDEALWDKIQQEALECHEKAEEDSTLKMYGYDSDADVIRKARANIRAAGLSEFIQVEQRDIRDLELPSSKASKPIFVVTNPPYGERIGDPKRLVPVYKRLGELIKDKGIHAAVLTSEPDLSRATKLWSYKQYSFMNGKIPCKLYLFMPKS